LAISTRVDGFPSTRFPIAPLRPAGGFSSSCFIEGFLYQVTTRRGGTGIARYQATPPTQERIMKLQFGQKQLVLELSASPFAWFYGQTERMSLTSLSLLFVQFSLFARQPAA